MIHETLGMEYIYVIQLIIPFEMQGRADSIIMTLVFASTPIGIILSGIIAEYISTANLFLGCSLVGIIIITIAWFFTELRQIEKILEKKLI